MTWQAWVLIGLTVLSVLVTVGTVGQPRRPTTPGTAVLTIVLGAVQIGLLLGAIGIW